MTDTANITETEYHNDGAAMNALAMLSNRQTGLGQRGRDKYLETTIALDFTPLTRPDLQALYRKSKICEKVVDLLPKAATSGNWLEVTIGKGRKGIPAKAVQYSEDLKLRSAVCEAGIMGRLDGDGFAIVGVDDGGEPWEPVNEGRIRKLSWVYPVDRWRIIPEHTTGRPGHPEWYSLYLSATNALPDARTSGKIHRSRVLRLPGKKLWGDMILQNGGYNDSVLQTFFQSFVKYLIAIEYSTRMVQDYNVFTYKLQGLAQLILQGDEEKIFHRFQAILTSMSSLGGLAMDADKEDAQFINRNFSGLDALIDRLKDDTSAAAAMPPTQVWGSSQKTALSNSSEGDKYAWADCVADYRSEIFDDPITDFFRLVFLAQNGPTGGRLPDSWGVSYKSALRLNLKEQTELRALQTEKVDVPSIEKGILLKEEVRDSAWSGSEYTIERQLQPDLWAKQQAKAEAEQPEPTVAPEAGSEGAELPDEPTEPDLEPRTDDATPAKRVIDWQGLKLGLQYQPFDIRHGKVLPVAYGHIQKTKGADGMACDCYVGAELESDRVYEVTQLVNGAFDEHKYMLGFDSLDAAREAFLKVMPAAMFGGIREVGLAGLEAYRTDGGSEGTNPKALNGGTSRIDAVNPILSSIDRADKLLQGLEDSAIERVNSALESSYKDLEAQILRRYSLETPGSLMAGDRAAVLLSQVADLLGLINTRNAEEIQQAFEDLLRGADAQGATLADNLARAIANQPLQATANVPVAAIVNQATEGMNRLRNHTEAFADRTSTVVTQGLIQGWGTDKVASLLQKELGLVRHKAETIARTESLSATNAAAKVNYEANGITLGTWQATADDRLCPTCGARNQRVYRLKDIVMPAHPRCLPGDVVVSGASVQAGTSRQYTGEVVVIQTASGKKLTATPNHPVLTDQGWVALDLIQKGDHVFSSVNSEDIPAAIAPDDYQCPTRISEVVAAFREASSVVSRSVKVSPEDFHGDGKGSEVCVVSADRLLWDKTGSQIVEPGVQLPLKRGLIGEQPLLTDRLLALGFPGQDPSLRCGMCGSGLPSPLLRSHHIPLEALSFGSASNLDSSSDQMLADDVSTNTQLLRDGVFRSTTNVLSNGKINVDAGILAPERHSSFDQSIANSRVAHTKLGRQARHRPSSDVLSNDVAIVECKSPIAKLDTNSLKPLSHAVMADTSISSQLTDGLPSVVAIDGLSVSDLNSGSIMNVDADSLEALVKIGSINAMPLGDGGDSGSSLIFRDEVVHVERKPFDGHVYNLETKTGWYFANNIVTHNCRCFISPMSMTWLELGLVDTAWAADFRARSLAELEALGLEPDYGRSAFEKANGLDAPEPVWQLEARSDGFKCDEWREDAGTPCGKSWIKAGSKCTKGVSSGHPSANPAHPGHVAYQGALAATSGSHTHPAAQPNHPDHAAYAAAHSQHGGKTPLPSGGGTAQPPTPSPTASVKKAAKRTTKKAATSTAAPPVTPVVATLPASPVKLNQAELKTQRAALEKRFGRQLVADAESNVKKVLDQADVFVRVGSADTLEKVLSGGFKTSAELGVTNHQIPNLADKNYQDARNRVEAKTLGYDAKNTQPGDRPIYGYLGGSDLNGQAHADVSRAYGSIAVKLKSDVKDRTSFTGADSFKSGIASEVNNPNAASLVSLTRHGYDRDKLPANYPSFMRGDQNDQSFLQSAARAKSIDDLTPKLSPTGNAYMEAQVHGKVTGKDIAEIHFSPSGVGDRPNAAIAQFAKDNQVPVFVNGKQLSAKDLDGIITPPKDQRSQRVKDLKDALDKGDIGAVATITDQIHKDAGNIKLAPGERDSILKLLYGESGFDAKPQVGTKADMDQAAKNGQTMMARGIGKGNPPNQYHDQFKTGDYHTGNGIYGNGTYVGHSGTYSSDGLTFKQGNSSSGRKRAVSGVAKHGYISGATINFRMALAKDAVVVTQKQMTSDLAALRQKVASWTASERKKILASVKKYTTADVKAHAAETTKVEQAYAGQLGKAKQTKTAGLFGDDTYHISIPLAAGAPKALTAPKFDVEREADIFGSSVTWNYTKPDGSRGTAKTLKAAIAAGTQAHYAKEAATRLGFADIPVVNQAGSDPVTQRKLKDLDDRASRLGNVLYGDEGNGASGRYAAIRGIDAIALNGSYEPNTFMNLLNRGKVLVEDTPFKYHAGVSV